MFPFVTICVFVQASGGQSPRFSTSEREPSFAPHLNYIPTCMVQVCPVHGFGIPRTGSPTPGARQSEPGPRHAELEETGDGGDRNKEHFVGTATRELCRCKVAPTPLTRLTSAYWLCWLIRHAQLFFERAERKTGWTCATNPSHTAAHLDWQLNRVFYFFTFAENG